MEKNLKLFSFFEKLIIVLYLDRHSRWYRYGNEMKEAERGYHNEDDEHFDDRSHQNISSGCFVCFLLQIRTCIYTL